jgi:hypothetical protein
MLPVSICSFPVSHCQVRNVNCRNREKKTICVKGKDPLPFEEWTFRDGQPVHVDHRGRFVAMTQPSDNIVLFE